MTDHLRSEQFIDAMDGALDPSLAAHLAGCEPCRVELEDLRAIVQQASLVEAPAPSPLFWDHFSDRVRQATAVETVPSHVAWWHRWMTPVGALAAAVGAVALVIALRPAPIVSPAGIVANESPAIESAPLADDGSWGLVVGLASELEWADVKEAAEPARGTADVMIDELTSAQREALLRLLQREMGEL